MAERTRNEDREVHAIIDVGRGALERVAQEFSRVDLHDKRLDRRLFKAAERLARSPASPSNEACGDWASTQTAYPLFDIAKAKPEAILAPHVAETVRRMAAQSEPVLAMQDTAKHSGALGRDRSADAAILWRLYRRLSARLLW